MEPFFITDDMSGLASSAHVAVVLMKHGVFRADVHDGLLAGLRFCEVLGQDATGDHVRYFSSGRREEEDLSVEMPDLQNLARDTAVIRDVLNDAIAAYDRKSAVDANDYDRLVNFFSTFAINLPMYESLRRRVAHDHRRTI